MTDFHLRRRIPPKSVNELTQEIVNDTGLTVWDAKALAQEMFDASLEGIYRLARIGEAFERLRHCPPSPLERETRPAAYWNGYADGWNGAQQWVRNNMEGE